jgi:hypothetical protein
LISAAITTSSPAPAYAADEAIATPAVPVHWMNFLRLVTM